MKLSVLFALLLTTAVAQAESFAINIFGERWIVSAEQIDSSPVSATFYNLTLKQTDDEGRATGPAYFLASNNNGWGDNALNLICEQLLDGIFPYAGGGKSTHSGLFAKDVLVIIGDRDQKGKAIDYELSDTNSATVFSRDLTCYESDEQASDSYE